MNNPGSHLPGKGSHWIVAEILAAFESSGGLAGSAARPARVDIKELVKQTLQEELARLEEKDVKDLKDVKDSND